MNDGVQKFTKLMLLILPCKGNALNKIKIALNYKTQKKVPSI